MEEIGISLDGQRSKSLKVYLAKVHFAHLFTVCDHTEKNCPQIFLTQGEHKHWDFEDPAAFEGSEEEKLAKFQEIRDQIDQHVQDWFAEIEISKE